MEQCRPPTLTDRDNDLFTRDVPTAQAIAGHALASNDGPFAPRRPARNDAMTALQKMAIRNRDKGSQKGIAACPPPGADACAQSPSLPRRGGAGPHRHRDQRFIE